MALKDTYTKFSTHFALLDFPVSWLYNRRLTSLYQIHESCMSACSCGVHLNSFQGCHISVAAPAIPVLNVQAQEGIEIKDCSRASWQNEECLLELFTHAGKITFSLKMH